MSAVRLRKYLRVVFLVYLLSVTSHAFGQLPAARLNGIFPAGARHGSTVECIITGVDMESVTGLYFSRAGIKAEPIGTTNRFQVTVDADVPPGPCDVRVVAARGLSNFRAFVVGDWPEVVEAEPDDLPERAQAVDLPMVINGRIDKPTDVDFYQFSLKKGQRIIVDCWAQRIDSPLDATIALMDSRGKELVYAGDDSGKDPLMDFVAPEDGDYRVKIWDFVYAGGPDFGYRLQIGGNPHVDAIVPSAIRPGEATAITILGRNLPGGLPAKGFSLMRGGPLETISRRLQVPADAEGLRGGEAIRPPQASLDGMTYRLETPEGGSNPIFVGFAADPVVVENEPNDAPKTSQTVAFPCEVSGAFDVPDDRDFYTFRVNKGEKVIVEVIGERQSGAIDPFLAGFNPEGKKMFSGDDAGGRNIGEIRYATTTRDPRWDFTASADGLYTVQVRDLYFQQRGDARYRYRLSVRRPRPDFRLFAVPSHDVQPDATTVGQGGRNWLDILAVRKDGFDGPILVETRDLPPGVSCDPVVIGPGKTSVPLVFYAQKDAGIGHGDIRIEGKAQIDGKTWIRRARGGGLTWPTVNTPGVARMADSVTIAVREAPPFVVSAEAESTEVSAGQTVKIAVKRERAADWAGGVQLSGFDLPPGATVPLVTIAPGASEAKLELKLPEKLSKGKYTFTISGAGQVPRDYMAQRDAKKPRGNNIRAVFPSNPITIEVR